MKVSSRYILYVIAIYAFAFSSLSQAEKPQWADWLKAQLSSHPSVVAAKEQWLATLANSDALSQPLYNPEIAADLERDGDANNYRLGIEQTIDLWDKQGALSKQGHYLKTFAQHNYQQVLVEKTGEALIALLRWQSAQKAKTIIDSQRQQLSNLLKLIQKRQKVGDLSASAAELTFLSLAAQLAEVAEAEANVKKSEAYVKELLPDWTPELGGIPESFWSTEIPSVSREKLMLLPRIAAAKAYWQSLAAAAETARRRANPDPTLGVNAGRDTNENVVGLTFSMPLHIRNTFTAEIRAAERSALEAKAKFQAIYRQQYFEWQASHAAWQQFHRQYQQWRYKVQKRVKESEALLRQQWSTGDLSTGDYLVALNQRAQSLLAGIKLEEQTRAEFIRMLLSSGQLTTFVLGSSTKSHQQGESK